MDFGSVNWPVDPWIDQACDEFRSAWREGRRPQIEDFLSRAAEPDREILLHALIATELELRGFAGETPTFEEYLGRFSDQAGVVGVVFDNGEGAGQGPVPDSLPALDHSATTAPITGVDDGLPTLSAGVLLGCDLPTTFRDESRLPERIGPYRPLRFLGQGGCGRVYHARHDDLDRPVAIKVVRDGVLGSRLWEELLNEAKLAAGLKHPAIVTVYDAGRLDDGRPYVVFEYIEGRRLDRWTREETPSLERFVRVMARVADATHYAHQEGLVHRDLKPSNILIDANGEPHVADFGLAVNADLQRLRMGQVAGTPAYMAPEQIRGETHRLDGRTDIWALGVILYHGLTGHLPFTGRTQDAIFAMALDSDPRPPKQINDRVPRELERICLACLDKRMTDRYKSAADLAEDLRTWLDLGSSSTSTASWSFEGLRLDPESRSAQIGPKGLRAFDEEDAASFLALLPGPRGRDGLPGSIRFWKSRIEDRQGDAAFSVGLLYGPSGGGKSSLVKAGLLPRLEGPVRAIYVESTPARTEAQLLAALRRSLPGLPEGRGPTEALAAIREGNATPPGVKVLLVLDQFEQWLHAHPNEPDAELIRALRQCDGRRLQALILVRDDFWMAITRLFKALEVPLIEGGNSAAVEPFDADHTRKVLVEFGRACGRLVDGPGGYGPEADKFLDQAVRELTGPDGRSTPVQLSLFAEVVRRRSWTPATLRDLGGMEGIGVTCLEEAFDSATAPPSYRLHRKAAQSVLQALLPSPTSVLRGGLRPSRELIEAAGHADRPGDFADLMRILDTELRMVTPVDPEAIEDGVPEHRLDHSEGYYQLAHDFLISPIRRWVERKQQATRSGRARLRLAIIAAIWSDRPSPRRLPSPLEWAGILWHTEPREWAAEERRMMRTATRHYSSRIALVVALIAVLSLLVKEVRDEERATAALEVALSADFRELPDLLPELAAYRDRLRDDLEQFEGNPSADGRGRNIAVLLLHRDWPTLDRAEALRTRLLDAGPDEVMLIRDALAAYPSMAGARDLRRVLTDDSADRGARLRVACALTGLEPVDAETWGHAATPLTQALLAEDRRTIPPWIDLLGPAASLLVQPLGRICCDEDRDPSTRSTAAEALAEVLARRGDVEGLARATIRAHPDASLVLLRELERHDGRGAARDVLRRELAATTGGLEGDDLANQQAMIAIVLAVLDEPEELWSTLRHRSDPGARTWAIQKIAALGLAPRICRERLTRAGVDPIQRQAILLAWAETDPDLLPTYLRNQVAGTVRELFQVDPDPGVHSAAQLLLQRWGSADTLAMADPSPPRQAKAVGVEGRRWERGPNGHTLVILPGPLEFWMGSPGDEPGRAPVEKRHYRRIDRSLAVGTTEVTVEQYRAFDRDYHPDARYTKEPGCPAGGISWYQSLDYCNWLSEQAGIPPDQWCYPEVNQPGMTLAKDAFDRAGFRLPTEAEWEYMCRAGTETSRSFGSSEAFLDRHAWTWLNSDERIAPSGRLLPNEFGLFDTLGNVWEWCHDGSSGKRYFAVYPEGTIDDPAPDPFLGMPDNVYGWRIVRGGLFEGSPREARSAHRAILGATISRHFAGFRVVRTLPPEGDTPRDR